MTFETITHGGAAIELLRRIHSGDEAAFREIEPLLAEIDKYGAARKKEREDKAERRSKKMLGGRKNSGRFEIARQIENGVDHSASGIVLIRKGDMRLVWRSGGNYFSGRGQQSYAPAELELMKPDGRSGKITDNWRKSHDGRETESHLSKALLLKYEAKIDAVFGAGATRKAALINRTLVLS